jgi:hypothetical protein
MPQSHVHQYEPPSVEPHGRLRRPSAFDGEDGSAGLVVRDQDLAAVPLDRGVLEEPLVVALGPSPVSKARIRRATSDESA